MTEVTTGRRDQIQKGIVSFNINYLKIQLDWKRVKMNTESP